MKVQLKALQKSKLIKSAATVVSGNSIAQIIVLLFSPLITRIYSPEVFGVQGVFLATISLLTPLIALRYPLAIVIAEDEVEVQKLEKLSLFTAASTTLILLLGLLFFGEGISRLLGLSEIGILVLFLPIALFLTAFQEISNYRASRNQRFKAISIVAAIQALCVNAARTIGGLISPIASVLITISSAAPGIQASMLNVSENRQSSISSNTKVTGKELVEIARKYRDFPVFRMPTDLLIAASHTAPVILLSLYFGPIPAGLYTLTRSALMLPSNVIGNAAGTVFYSHFADMDRQHRALFPSAFKSIFTLLFGLGTLIMLVTYFGPAIFAFFFGESWREAGIYAQWLGIATAFSLAHVPAVRLAPVIKKQGLLLGVNVFIVVCQLASILISAEIYQDPLKVVMAFAMSSAAGSLILITTILYSAKTYDTREIHSVEQGLKS